MKNLTDEEVMAEVERRLPREVTKLRNRGERVCQRALFMFVRAAKGESEFFIYDSKASFSKAAQRANQQSRQLTQEAQKLRKKAPKYDFGANQILNAAAELLEAKARNVKNRGDYARNLVTIHGKSNHDEGILVAIDNVIAVDPDFNLWEALARVGAEIYEIFDRDSKTITADKLMDLKEQILSRRQQAAATEKRATSQHVPGTQH
jgi:hypothetical protein